MVLHGYRREDSMAQLISCERCNTIVEDHVIAHSSLIVLQKISLKEGYTFYQCDNGSSVDHHTYQHWHCSHDCMQEGMLVCIQGHYQENLLKPPAIGNVVNLHTFVLSDVLLTCTYCAKPLDQEAYRFCITMATPVNHIPDNSHLEKEQWCCSLAHAKECAMKTIITLEQRKELA
jgi:hypothetical protein